MAGETELLNLPQRHRDALAWFQSNAGTIQPWPQPLSDGTFLVSKAKGIYKPQWTNYALSIRQTLGGPYPDEDPVHSDSNGPWTYRYFQEGSNPEERDQLATNRGLMSCMHDHIPVGVMRQVGKKPTVRYSVMGLANVTAWNSGYFTLEEFRPSEASRFNTASSMRETVDAAVTVGADAFNASNLTDARERVAAQIVRRRGQPQFRKKLVEIYEGKCAFTGCDALEALEAAHIVPYLGPETNHASNGILLRADIHTLFDLGLLSVADDLTIVVGPALQKTTYAELSNKAIRQPGIQQFVPSLDALKRHRAWAKL